MRRREISPEFWTDERVVGLSDPGKLLFIGLWGLADREGRLEDKPLTIGFKVRPWAPQEVPALLAELERAGVVMRYESAGERVILIPKFAEHQNIHPKEMASKLPPPTPAPGNSTAGREVPRIAAEGTNFIPGSSSPSGPSFPAGSSGSGAPAAGKPLAIVKAPDRPLPELLLEERGRSGAAYFAFIQGERRADGYVSENPDDINARALASWFTQAMLELGGDVTALDEAYAEFARDPYWVRKRLPFKGFMSQWQKFAPRVAREARP